MDDIKEVGPEYIGKWVEFRGGTGESESGRITSWTDKYVRVVYRCDNQWHVSGAAGTNSILFPGALARAPLVASLPPFNCYEVGFCKRQRKACASRVRIESSRIHTSARVRVTPVSYWAGVAGGGSGLASVRTSFISPVRSSNTCRLGTILHLKCWAIAGPGGAPP